MRLAMLRRSCPPFLQLRKTCQNDFAAGRRACPPCWSSARVQDSCTSDTFSVSYATCYFESNWLLKNDRSDHFSKCWRAAAPPAPAKPARRLVHRGTLRGETGPQLRSCSRSRGLGASNTFRGVSGDLKKIYIYLEVLRACALGFGHSLTFLEDSRWSRVAGFGGCKRVFCLKRAK